MYSTFILFLLSCVLCSAYRTLPPSEEELFEEFIEKYNKVYDEEEKDHRFYYFKKNLQKLKKFNEDGNNLLGINGLADLSIYEFKARLGYRASNSKVCKVRSGPLGPMSIPESLDYRKSGLVTRVKNQGHCGSCYSFSTTGNIESQYAKKYKELVEFSEQQIMDCDFSDNACKTGCFGGDPIQAMEDIMNDGGLATEQDYSYKNEHDPRIIHQCELKEKNFKVKLAGCDSWNVTNEEELKQVLVKYGPLSVSMAWPEDIEYGQMYDGGIIRKESLYCQACEINHCLLLVGYGKENGVPYWIIKNSWGTVWGEEGYFRMEIGVNCMKIINEVVNAVIA